MGSIAPVSLFQKRYGFLLGAPFLTKFLVVFCHRVLKNTIFFLEKECFEIFTGNFRQIYIVQILDGNQLL